MDSGTFAPICWVKNPFHPVIDFQCSSCGQLPIACEEADYALTYVNCEFGCGATYCCTQCRDTAMQQNHDMLCVGPYDEFHPIYKLKVLALESGAHNFSTIHLAAILVCCHDDDKIIVDESCLTMTNEAFAGTYELIVQILNLKHRPVGLTSHRWQCILQNVARMKVEGTTKSRFASECERLTTADEWLQGSYLFHTTCEEATLEELMDEPACFFPDTQWTALYDREFNHSCIPTHFIRSRNNGVAEMKLQRLSDNNTDNRTTTISMIDNSKDLTMRTQEIDDKGQTTCLCMRCAFERCPGDNLHTTTMLQTILDLAIVQARYDDAMDAIEGLVRLEPTNSIWLFTRARIAGWQHDFLRRERLLQTAALVCPNDKVIVGALNEVHAYYRKGFTELASKMSRVRVPVWNTVEGLEGFVFVGERILDCDQCVNIVHVAEQYQQQHPSGGWTTSRHYAVPTTDIPLYQIPEILAWFNIQLEMTIFPAMELQFDIQGRLRIFDAFLVKYDADGEQKRLPLHNDQSDYSLTIAMNSVTEYRDGGTYFVDTDETYKTDIGGIVSFRGDLLHAGKRITSGTRYVIVCFIYQEARPSVSK